MNEYGFKFFLLDMAWSHNEIILQGGYRPEEVAGSLSAERARKKHCGSDLASTGLYAVKSASQSFDHVPAHVQMCLSILLANYAAVFFRSSRVQNLVVVSSTAMSGTHEDRTYRP